eukprot:TRINITY_DN33415_c0_g1_i2.p1 TRINITY_DN33415_c0_g1~~TRINITY_DN33415_c0_g1_i2.p1  ORF type:complete len:606 (+),score=130.21 TRINITY_DN33415_c0_g1_i2:156-1973(+)
MGVQILLNIVALVGLISLSGLFSGLTLGLLGLDLAGLDLQIKAGSERDARCASKIRPIRASGNLLLCTLLLGNVAVNAAISVLMSDMTSGLMGFLISTVVIVIFGEIMPQATCSRYALQIGAAAAPIVKVVMVCVYILAKPLALVLDVMLGQETPGSHSKDELKEILRMQLSLGSLESGAAKIAQGTLEVYDRAIGDFMVPVEEMFTLDAEELLDYTTISKVHSSGFSRIPVVGKSKFGEKCLVGMLLAKDLVLVDPANLIPVGLLVSIFKRDLIQVEESVTVGVVLDIIQKNATKLAVVVDSAPTVKVCCSDPPASARSRNSVAAMECGAVKLTRAEISFESVVGIVSHSACVNRIFQDELREGARRAPPARPPPTAGVAFLRSGSDMSGDGIFLKPDSLRGSRRLTESEVVAHLRNLQGQWTAAAPALNARAPVAQVLQHALRMVSVVRMIKLKPQAAPHSTFLDANCLYKANCPLVRCGIIISGRVKMLVGQDKLTFFLGPSAILGCGALDNPDNQADFDAYIESDEVAIVWLTKDQLEGAAPSSFVQELRHRGGALAALSGTGKAVATSEEEPPLAAGNAEGAEGTSKTPKVKKRPTGAKT